MEMTLSPRPPSRSILARPRSAWPESTSKPISDAMNDDAGDDAEPVRREVVLVLKVGEKREHDAIARGEDEGARRRAEARS